MTEPVVAAESSGLLIAVALGVVLLLLIIQFNIHPVYNTATSHRKLL